MAKQNVTFIERQFEKILVGVAAAVLLGAVVMYGVNTPNKVDGLAPGKFYAYLKAYVDKTRHIEGTIPPVPPLPTLPQPGMSGIAAVLIRPLPPIQPPNEDLPDVKGFQTGDLALVEALAPRGIVVLEGRVSAKLPAPEAIMPGGVIGNAAGDELLTAQDHSIVNVFGVVDREEYRGRVKKGGYHEIYEELIVARVEAEREELQPDGRWGQSTRIYGYAPKFFKLEERIPAPATQPDGQVSFAPQALDILTRTRTALCKPEAQAAILRPPFQQFIEDFRAPNGQTQHRKLQWPVPQQPLPGYDGIELANYSVLVPDTKNKKTDAATEAPVPLQPARLGAAKPAQGGVPGAPGGPRGAAPKPAAAPGAPAVDPKLTRRLQQNIADAKKAIDKGKVGSIAWAEKLLNEVTRLGAQGSKECKEAEAILNSDRFKNRKALAEKRLRDQEARRQALGIVRLGDDQEPLWLTDISVEPGKVYRYRVRVVAFNDYAGQLGKLANPKDAERLLIEGNWSKWSEPITVYLKAQAFITEVRENRAKVEIQQWVAGAWKTTGKRDVEIGQALSFDSGQDTLSYDGIVVGFDDPRPFSRVTESNGKKRMEPPVDTPVVILARSNGQVEEHLVAEDVIKFRTHQERRKRELELLSSDLEQGATSSRSEFNLPARIAVMGPTERR